MNLYILQTKVTRMIVTVTDDLDKAQRMLVSNLAINPAYIGPGLVWNNQDDFQWCLKAVGDVATFLRAHREKCGLEIVVCNAELSIAAVEDPGKLRQAMFEVEGFVTDQGRYETPCCFQVVEAAMCHFTGGKVS